MIAENTYETNENIKKLVDEAEEDNENKLEFLKIY